MDTFASSALGKQMQYRAGLADAVFLVVLAMSDNGGVIACRSVGSTDAYSSLYHTPAQVQRLMRDYESAELQMPPRSQLQTKLAGADRDSFVIDMALGMLGLTDAQKQEVEAALPDADALVDLANANMPLINQVVALINKAMPQVQAIIPALTIVADAIAKQQQGGGGGSGGGGSESNGGGQVDE